MVDNFHIEQSDYSKGLGTEMSITRCLSDTIVTVGYLAQLYLLPSYIQEKSFVLSHEFD